MESIELARAPPLDWLYKFVCRMGIFSSQKVLTNPGENLFKLETNVLRVVGPTGESGSLLDSDCSCSRCHIRFDSSILWPTEFACSSADVQRHGAISSFGRAEDEAVIYSVGNGLSAGAVLLGCGLEDGKLATFQLMEDCYKLF